MAASIQSSFRLSFRSSLRTPLRGTFAVAALLAVTPLGAPAFAQSAPAAVPVPFTTALSGDGVAPSTANACAGSIETTSGTTYGDGCTAAGGLLNSPQGVGLDKYGNVYIADYNDRLVRVIYYGGVNVAAAITAANSGYTISATRNAPAVAPVVGDIYTIAGFGGTATAALSATATDGKYECANYATSGQPEALNSLGDGCPAASAVIGPRDVAVDNDGNLFLTDYTNSRIRVLCVDCATGTMAAALIELEDPGITPVNGAMYTIIGFTGGYRDGYPGYIAAANTSTTAALGISLLRSPTAAVVSSSDDVYIGDNLNNAVRVLYNGGTAAKNILVAQGQTPQLGYVYTIAGANCVSAATTKTGSITGDNSCLQTTPGASGYPATADTAAIGNNTPVSVAWTVYLDASGNLFYSDAGNARIKVLYGGIAPPLTFPTAAYATLQNGYSYSFAGQGTSGGAGTQDGVAPSAVVLSSPQGVSGDASGNIFFIDYGTGLFYETYAQNGITAIIGGGNAITTAAANAYCNGGTTGPQMTDAFYDGCPFTQAKLSSPRGPIVADADGNLYFGDSVGYFVRKLSYNSTFPTTAVDAISAAQPYAFTFLSAHTLAAPTLLVSGGPATGYTDAGGDTCTAGLAATAGAPGTTCVVNVTFTPKLPGLRPGAVELSSATAVLGSALFSGTSTGAALSVDPGTSTTTGTGLVPSGVTVDGAGRVYVSDSTSKSVLRYTGSAATTIATGFTAPTGVAVDGAGDVFVADASADTVTEIPVTGSKFTLVSNLAGPQGLAVSANGTLYIANSGSASVLAVAPGATTATVVPFSGLASPLAVAVDAAGNLYVADPGNIYKLTPAGVQTTFASVTNASGVAVDAAGNVLVTEGTTLSEYPASGGAAITLATSLIVPKAVALDASGNAYIADNGYGGYVEFQRTAGLFKFTSAPQTATINLTSSGNASLTEPTFTQSDTADFTLAAASSNGCSGALSAGTTCALTATFNPLAAGTVTDSVSFTSNAANAPTTLTLTGTTVPLVPTLSLSVAPSTLAYGSTETLSANVSGVKSTAGSVTFLNGVTVIAAVATDANGNAVFAYQPAFGSYTVTATFTPTGSTSPTITSASTGFIVTQATPSIGLTTLATSGYAGATSFTLTATVQSATTGTPTGSVMFYAGTTNLGSVALTGSAASLVTTSLPVGSDCVTAVYSGDTNFVTVTSSCVNITVSPGFSVTSTATALAFQTSYQEAQAYLTINPGGLTDTLTFACQGLPAKLSCAFTPSTLTLAGGSTAASVQMLVSNSNATASLQLPAAGRNSAAGFFAARAVALAALPLGALLLFGLRRRRLPTLIALVLLTLGATGLSGCGSGPTALEQSSGSYHFTVTADSGSTTLQTLNFTLTIP